MRHFITLSLLSMGLMLAACGTSQQDAAPPKAKEGRAETQGIRNTDAIGYSGGAIANKVDGVLNENDQKKGRMDQMMNAQEATP